MTISADTKTRRLERAGFVALRSMSGYVTAAFARRIAAQVETNRATIDAILAEPPKPRGRPRKLKA
jgi:hypothetical protein